MTAPATAGLTQLSAGRTLRETLEALDPEASGHGMHSALKELYPLCRSLTGNGVRESLALIGKELTMKVHEVPTGTQVLDWVVPKEWNLRSARLTGPDGAVICDAAKLNLHLVGYSVPFRGQLSLEELQPHLHSLPDQPELVPYRQTYHRPDWGFCLSHAERSRLQPGTYTVEIDTTLEDGALTYGEVVLPGASDEVVLISAHVCHPSLANDNLSGVVVAAAMARALRGLSLRYTYRFVFAPVTLGAICWLAQNEAAVGRVAHGMVLAGLGVPGPYHWKKSRRGNAEVDRAAALVLAQSGEASVVREFSPWGYDERQYCSPGYDLPVGCFSRVPHGEYPEYHTSADSPQLVQAASLAGALVRTLAMVEILEGNGRYLNLSPRGEPQLSRRGLFAGGGGPSRPLDQLALLHVLNFSDGAHSLLDIAERSRLAFHEVLRAARALQEVGLLATLPEPAKETPR